MKKSIAEIMEIAIEELARREKKWNCGLNFYVLIDAGDFFCVGYEYENPEDEGIIPLQNHIDIDAQTGDILIAKPYRPWSEYGKKLDAGEKLDIPEKYLNCDTRQVMKNQSGRSRSTGSRRMLSRKRKRFSSGNI